MKEKAGRQRHELILLNTYCVLGTTTLGVQLYSYRHFVGEKAETHIGESICPSLHGQKRGTVKFQPVQPSSKVVSNTSLQM